MKPVAATKAECNSSEQLPQPENAQPTKEFDWRNDDSIILCEQPETAVYFNRQNSLVIRQRRWPDEDAFIYITEPHIDAFLDKITAFRRWAND
jgi:hypothetical protein